LTETWSPPRRTPIDAECARAMGASRRSDGEAIQVSRIDSDLQTIWWSKVQMAQDRNMEILTGVLGRLGPDESLPVSSRTLNDLFGNEDGLRDTLSAADRAASFAKSLDRVLVYDREQGTGRFWRADHK
jgi:hypothetical protein